MFAIIINIADNIFEKRVCLLLLSHLFFLYQTLSIFFNLRKLTYKYVYPSPLSPHRGSHELSGSTYYLWTNSG